MRTEQPDDAELITPKWLSTWAAREVFCWTIPGTDLLIAKSRNPLKTSRWWILSEADDGSEPVLATVQNRGDVREYLESVGAKADGVVLADFE